MSPEQLLYRAADRGYGGGMLWEMSQAFNNSLECPKQGTTHCSGILCKGVGSLAAQCLCTYAVGTKLQLTIRKLITLRHEMLVQSLCNSLASCDPPSLMCHSLPSVLMAITQSIHDCATAVTWRIGAGSSPASCDPPSRLY